MPLPAPILSETSVALCILCIFLVPFGLAGLALISTGLGRSRSSAHAMMASLCVIAVAAVAYFVCGFSWQGFIGLPAHSFMVGGKAWSWIAAEPLFMHGLEFNGSAASLAAWLQILSVGLAALIPLGAGADRWRLSACCASTALFAGWTYPLFAHWVWGGGWLAQLGVNYGLGHGFVDAGGASSIQVVGGLTALSIAWILGPRRGKYSSKACPPPSPVTTRVCLVRLLVRMGWMVGAQFCRGHFVCRSRTGRIVLVGVNTTLAALSAA